MQTKRRNGALALGAILALGLILSIAGTGSTLKAPRPSSLVLVPPEHEGLQKGAADPNEYMDLKESSARPVTIAEVRRAQAQAEAVPAAANGIGWQQLGPYNIGGRLVDVVADKQTAGAVYVAASGGGVWHSTDNGVHWNPVWPNDNVQNMGSLAQASDGTLWAGTGEANPPGGGLTYFGDGIYKSTDGGAHWTNMGLRDSAAIGRIAVDPTNPNVVFAAASGHVARSVPERGLYRTSDGGQTWQRVIAPANATTGAIDVAIDPSNHNRVFAAMWDHIRNNGARVYGGIGSGLFRSDDGGQTWTRLQNIVDPLPDYDRPTDGGGAGTGTLTSGSTTVTNVVTTSGAFQAGHHLVGSGIPASTFITAVNGNTLTISKAATASANRPLTDFRAPTGLTADASLGRIGVTIAPSNPNRVYVVTGSPYGPDKGFYFSDDGGDSFHVGAQAYQPSSGYQWWFGRLWVDPEDQQHIFNADVQLRTSTDGGATWTGISQPHSDQHGMDWDMSTFDNNPATPMRVWLGNDGGAYRSDNSGRPNSWIQPGIPPATGTTPVPQQPWNQSYHLDVSRTDPQRLVTGLQDNGSKRSWTPPTASPSDPELRNWSNYGNGDGHWTLIDPNDQTYYYECFQPSPPSQSCSGFHDLPNGTTQTLSISNTGWPSNQRWTTDTPIALDPNIPPKNPDGTQPLSALYLGGTVLGRSLDRRGSWQIISPNDPADPNLPEASLPGRVPANENDLGPFYANEYATISAIAPAKSQTPVPYAQTIYVGTDTGRVWKTTDAGASWTRLQGLPTRWVNALVVDPGDQNHVYAAFSGYREGDEAANVYETRDGGATWTNISQNMPNGPVEMITYDAAHDVLFAATDVGVFDHKDNDSYWYKISVGMPNVPVLDVKLSGDGKYVFAATFGRSVWKLPLSTDATDGGGAGGSVPATLALNLGPSASFGPFQPGQSKDYTATQTANVVSTAGDATLSVADPSAVAPGHLVNGSFSLPSALQAKASSPAGVGGDFGTISGSPLALLTYAAPVSNDGVTLTFQQHIGDTDALRTGSYAKTLTFTLSTTNP